MNVQKQKDWWVYEMDSPRWVRGFAASLHEAAERLIHFGANRESVKRLISSANAKGETPT